MDQPVTSARAAGLSVSVSAVRRVFEDGTTALDGLSLEIPPGQFVAILGPSGCGKSTLLRLIAGLDKPQGGSISVDPVATAGRRGIAYVFQDAHLLPWRNVLHNVALPLELMHVDRRARIDASRLAIERVGLTEAVDRYPNQLSGGMRMRVSLARAMVTEPKLLLLDEPFAALDEITRQKLDEQLHTIWANSAMTVVFVTHSTSEAVFLAERAIVLSRRPGRIVEDHQIELSDVRDADIRGTSEFAAQTRVLYDALRRGESE
jgi:NitT/TauT family transport system ATP-binding protein